MKIKYDEAVINKSSPVKLLLSSFSLGIILLLFFSKTLLSFFQELKKLPSFGQESTIFEKAEENYYTTKNWADVNLREGAGNNFPSIRIVKAFSQINVLKEEGDWLYVNFRGLTGYVSRNFCYDREGFYVDSYQTHQLTEVCHQVIEKYFYRDWEKEILYKYEFRYLPDWISERSRASLDGFLGLCSDQCIYIKASFIPDLDGGWAKLSHDQKEIILHEMCHAIDPLKGSDGYKWFTLRFRKAAREAGLDYVMTHSSKNNYVRVQTKLRYPKKKARKGQKPHFQTVDEK